MIYRFVGIIKLLYRFLLNPKQYNVLREMFRISRLERYRQFRTRILKHDLLAIDSRSFLAGYREIFENEIYRFRSGNHYPLILDCGANIGLSVIYFKRLYPDARIIAFEPDEKSIEALKYNITSFGFKDVQIIELAVSFIDGEAQFFQEGADGSRIATTTDKENIKKIKTTRLAGYLNQRVDFLKIDIEGMEYEVLKDCQDKLKNVKNLFVEYHSFSKNKQKLDEILAIIKQAGFRYYVSQSGTLSPSPLWEIKMHDSMDLQLNIFAYRQ